MGEDPARPLAGQIVFILVLSAINAFLAGAEMAFVALNPTRIREMAEAGDRKAKRVERLLQDADSFLSVIQVGITFAGFFNSASASQAFVGRLLPALGAFPAAKTVATAIVTLIISYFTLVVSELYPKQIALQVPERYACWSASTILALRAGFRPFVWLLNVSTGLLKRLTPLDFSRKEEKLTRSEMKKLLSSSRTDGAIDAEEFNMMRGVLSLDTRLVREIMVPRVDTEMIDVTESPEENLATLLSQRHSRVPLYADSKDNVVGIVHLKDVLVNLDAMKRGEKTLMDIARPPLLIPDTLFTDELLVKFQESKQHLAVLVDEFGGMSGIVTLEDLMEEIVGEIQDEYDDDAEPYRKLGEGRFLLRGNMAVSDVNRVFDLHIMTEDADTIAGFITERLGYIPSGNGRETVDGGAFSLTVMEADTTRIMSVLLRLGTRLDRSEMSSPR